MRLALLLALAFVTAGCATPEAAKVAPQHATALPGQALASAPASNDSIGSIATRAIWRNHSSITVLEKTVTVVRDQVGGPAGTDLCESCGGAGVVPDEGAGVPPGTARVEITATWTSPDTVPDMRMNFAYRTASDKDPTSRVVKSGETVVVPLLPEDADAPLQRRSTWSLGYFPYRDYGDPRYAAAYWSGLERMRLHVKMVAFPARELPTFPPPADAWQNGTTLTLIEGMESRYGGAYRTYLVAEEQCGDPCLVWQPTKGYLVPPGARSMTATLQYDTVSTDKPVLHYTLDRTKLGPALKIVKDEPGKRVFQMDLNESLADSPYQLRSSWGFYASFQDEGPRGNYATTSEDWRITVLVSKTASPPG